jgi:hypothetical protein
MPRMLIVDTIDEASGIAYCGQMGDKGPMGKPTKHALGDLVEVERRPIKFRF